MNKLSKWVLTVFLGVTMAGFASAEEGAEGILWQEVPDVVSVASKHKQTPQEAPSSVTIITAADIKKYGYQTLADALQGVRGLFVNYDRNYKYLGVRGFCIPGDFNSRVLITINEHSINNISYGESFIDAAFMIDLNNVERIEIARGPGSALYGSNALFAVINVVTRNAQNLKGVETTASVGSFGMNKGTLSYGAEYQNGLNLFLSLSDMQAKGQDLFFKEFDAPATNDGWAMHADMNRSDSYLFTASLDKFTLQAAGNSRTKNIPTAPFGTVFNDDRTRTTDDSSFVELKYESKLGQSKEVMSRIYYDKYDYYGHYIYDFGPPNGIVDYPESANDNRFGIETKLNWNLFEGNLLTTGVEYQKLLSHQKTWNDVSGVVFDKNNPYGLYSIYLQDEYQATDRIKFVPGLRLDKYSDRGMVSSPRLAFLYSPVEDKSTMLKLLYGEAFRVPNSYELYYTDLITAKPNLDLKPEKIKTAEVVLEQSLSKDIKGTASIYQWNISDLIAQVTDPSDNLLQFQNIEKARARGIELGVTKEWENGTNAQVNYALQETVDLPSNKELTDSPRHNVQARLSYPILKDKTFLSVETQYLSKRITLAGRHSKPLFATNLTFFAREIRAGLDISASVYNLFDAQNTSLGGQEHLQDEINQDGRGFRFQLTYRF